MVASFGYYNYMAFWDAQKILNPFHIFVLFLPLDHSHISKSSKGAEGSPQKKIDAYFPSIQRGWHVSSALIELHQH